MLFTNVHTCGEINSIAQEQQTPRTEQQNAAQFKTIIYPVRPLGIITLIIWTQAMLGGNSLVTALSDVTCTRGNLDSGSILCP